MKGVTATQDWLRSLTIMQQSVLLAAIRGPDGIPKYHPIKYLLRWYRRCVLRIALMEGLVLTDPALPGGGSFTGPSLSYKKRSLVWEKGMNELVDRYLRSVDELPHHFQLHFMHAVEILGYKHPDDRIRQWWLSVYLRLVNDLHLNPETEAELDERLGDEESSWRKWADPATMD